ncbi:MAG: aminopeptidase N [Proteobacteria bacterium]|nr:aminopeptidase N [Pseudomonadota bacterium]
MTPQDYLFDPNRNPMIRSNYRPAEYKIDKVDLHINLDETDTEVRSRISVERNPAMANLGGPLVLDGENLKLKSVKILENGALRDLDQQEFIVTDKNLILKRPPAGRFELEIVTEINPAANTELQGIYTAGGIICSQCESQGFRRITYFLDRPDNLAVFTTTLEADKQKYPVMLSNGNGDYSASTDLGNGCHSMTWSDPWPKPSYLFATVAGDMKVLEDTFTTMSNKKVALRVFVQPGYEDKIQWAMESVKHAMKWDEVKYGREYDLDCFHIVATDKFNAGAMENKGLNIFNVSALVGNPLSSTDAELIRIEDVIGHEYFHNWTGDRVTVRDWFELSLKESLTSLREHQFISDMHSHAIETIDDAIYLRANQFIEDSGPNAHFVRPERVEAFENIYSTTIYQKGKHVLAMMNTILGDTMWRKAMDNYFNKFDGQSVTVDDFIDNMQDVSGIDLKQFRRWYSQSGTPEISYEGVYDAAAKTYSLTLTQNTPATADQPQSEKQNLHIPVTVGLIGQSGKDVAQHLLNLTEKSQTFVFENVAGPVVPSVLRGFSAPVKVTTQPSDEELIFRMAHDSDPFNKYEATERLMLKTINNLIRDYDDEIPFQLSQDFIDAYGANLASATEGDQAFAARVLTLPPNGLIIQGLKEVDPDAVKAATDFLNEKLATTFKSDFERIYQETTASAGEVYDLSPEQVGRRELHNTSLYFLGKLEAPEVATLAEQQYLQSQNMTEKLRGLSVLSRMEGDAGTKALEDFYRTYKDNPNVVNKWLSLQASIPTGDVLGRVKELMHHEAFDITNPNKVSALISGFVSGNPTVFHKKDGSGYKLLADLVIELNGVNPKTGSRLVQTLTQFKRYGEDRQKLMLEQMERIMATPKLDSVIKELVGQALATADKKPATGTAKKFGQSAKPK